MTNDVFPALTKLMHEAIGDLLAPSTSFSEMCAETVIFEAPFAPGGAHVLRGRDAVDAYLPDVVKQYLIPELRLIAMHRSANPGVVILEFLAHNARGAKTGIPYPQAYINVIKLRDGKIQEYKDYWNPDVAVRAIGVSGVS